MSDDKYDKILFDHTDLFILDYYKDCEKPGYRPDPCFYNHYQQLKIIESDIKNKLFFSINFPYREVDVYGKVYISSHQGISFSQRTIIYVFKNYIVYILNHAFCKGQSLWDKVRAITIIKHNLPIYIYYLRLNIFN